MGGRDRGGMSFHDDEALCVRVDESSDDSGQTPLSHLMLSSKLTLSSKRFTARMGERMPESKVHTREEKRNFRDDLALLVAGEQHGRTFSSTSGNNRSLFRPSKARGRGCVRGSHRRDAAWSSVLFGRGNLLEGWPCGGREQGEEEGCGMTGGGVLIVVY